MRPKRYGVNNTYRGRRDKSAVLKILIAVLAVLLVGGLLFILLLGKYVEYTDDGVKLSLPWGREEERAEDPVPTGSDLIITEQPQPEPSETAAPRPLGAVEVSREAVLDGTAAELAGENAIVVTVKDEEGRLAWLSGSELARSAGDMQGKTLNGTEAFSKAAAELAGQRDVYLVARVVCFRDLWMCVYDRSMALTASSGKLWYDSKGMPWLSPASEGARAYLDGLCVELAELGFDEILLDCAGFPEDGRLSAVARGENYPAEGRDEAVARWLDGLARKLENSGTVLSVRAGRKDLGECPSGRTAQALMSVRRIWVEEEADASGWVRALKEAGADDADARLVRILPAGSAEPEEPAEGWAVLTE